MRKICLFLLLFFAARFAYSQAPACGSTIATYPYFESFEAGPGGWISGGTNASWALGYPYLKQYITYLPADSSAWFTNLNGTYNPDESSYVMSPCFNFTGMVSPVIEMKVWWEIEHNHDGAVLQTSIDNGLTWHNVGNFGDPDNWYNSSSIVTLPGGQGWTGRQGSSPGNGSGGWVTIKHKLNGLSGQPSVRVRIFFASGPAYEDDGFAFDNVKVYDTPGHDAGVTAIVAPVSKCGSTAQENVIIQVKNYGYLPQTAIPVSYRVGNNPPVTETINALIQPEATFTYTFNTKLNLATPGTYQLTAQTHLPNDTSAQNNAATFTATAIPTINSFPYFQNFENGDGGWLASGRNSSWALGTPQKSIINSAASGLNAWVTNLNGPHHSEENSFVISPCLDMSSLVSPLLTMKIWWNSEEGYDGAVLQASVDGGTTWQTVGNFQDAFNWYNHPDILAEPGETTAPVAGWSGSDMSFPATGSNGWVTAKHLLPGLGGQPNVRLRVAFASDAGFFNLDGFAFDDVAIYENPAHDVGITALLAPVSGNCGAGTQETVTVTLHNYGSAAQQNIPLYYTVNNGSPVNATLPGPLAPGATATFSFPTPTNLSNGGSFIVAASTALAADTFFTNNLVTDTVVIFNPVNVYPYEQDFENCTVDDPGIFPPGWELTHNKALFYPYSWLVGNGPTFFQGTGPNADHTSGTPTGQYLYAPVAGRSGSAGDSTELITACFNVSALTNPGFSFWYHMAGADINQLEVQTSVDNGLTWVRVALLSARSSKQKPKPGAKKPCTCQAIPAT